MGEHVDASPNLLPTACGGQYGHPCHARLIQLIVPGAFRGALSVPGLSKCALWALRRRWEPVEVVVQQKSLACRELALGQLLDGREMSESVGRVQT